MTRRVLGAAAIFLIGLAAGWGGHWSWGNHSNALREVADVLGLETELVRGRVDKRQEPPFRQIILERWGGLCPCPSYEVAFNMSGAVTYEGRAFVARPGRHEGLVPPRHFILLAIAADRMALASLAGRVAPEIDADFTVVTLVDWEGQRYQVQAVVPSERDELWDFVAAMERLVEEIAWGRQQRR